MALEKCIFHNSPFTLERLSMDELKEQGEIFTPMGPTIKGTSKITKPMEQGFL